MTKCGNFDALQGVSATREDCFVHPKATIRSTA